MRHIMLDEVAKGIDAGGRVALDAAARSVQHTLASLLGWVESAAVPGHARRGGELGRAVAPGDAVLGALGRLPRLADQADEEQVSLSCLRPRRWLRAICHNCCMFSGSCLSGAAVQTYLVVSSPLRSVTHKPTLVLA
jgi:hypothetical protein